MKTLLASVFTKHIGKNGGLHCVGNGILAKALIGPGKFLNTRTADLAIVPRKSSQRRFLNFVVPHASRCDTGHDCFD